MTDLEIKKYLDDNNWTVNAQEGVIKILNTSHQIISTDYDFINDMLTIMTPENEFTFKWILHKNREGE